MIENEEQREPLSMDGHTNGTLVIDGYAKGSPWYSSIS